MRRLTTTEFMGLSLFFTVLFVVACAVLGTMLEYSVVNIAFTFGFVAAFLFNFFFMVLNYFPEFLQPVIKATPVDSEILENTQEWSEAGWQNVGWEDDQIYDAPEVVWDEGNPRDITAGINSPYIRPSAKPEPIIVDGKSANLYQLNDIVFDFQKRPHTLLIGESGSGKTVTLFNILNLIKQQYQNVKFVIIDYGNQDFEQSYPTDLQTFLNVTEHMFYIMKGRQLEGKAVPKQRIIWVVEEFESVLGEIKILSKAEQDLVFMRLANIGRMARKLGLNMVFVAQSALASDFPTSLRNNFGNRVIMRLANNKLVNSFGCSYRVDNLPTGYSWMSTFDDFVQWPFDEEPEMDIIPYNDLRRLSKNYEKKYNLRELDSEYA